MLEITWQIAAKTVAAKLFHERVEMMRVALVVQLVVQLIDYVTIQIRQYFQRLSKIGPVSVKPQYTWTGLPRSVRGILPHYIARFCSSTTS